MASKKKAPVVKAKKKNSTGGDQPVRVGRAARQKPLSGKGYGWEPVVASNGSLGPGLNSDMGADRAFRRAVNQAKKQNKGITQKRMAVNMKYKNRLERTKGQ